MVAFILYVAEQERSKIFYERVLGETASLHVPGMTEFNLNENCKLGLMPENGIAKILGKNSPHPKSGNGVPRCELYLYTEDIGSFYERLLQSGAKEISAIEDRGWGDRVCYFADPDGHIIAIAERMNKATNT